MPSNDEKPSFWATLPGILTGVAAVITAGGALFLGLRQTGSLPPPQRNGTASQAVAPQPSQGSVGNAAHAEHDAAQPVTAQPVGGGPPTAVRITKKDGTTLWSYESKFSWGDQTLNFDSGQSIPFEKIRTIDVLGLDDNGKIDIQVTLSNGEIVHGSSTQFSYDLYGANDLGDIRVSRKELKQVTFPH